MAHLRNIKSPQLSVKYIEWRPWTHVNAISKIVGLKFGIPDLRTLLGLIPGHCQNTYMKLNCEIVRTKYIKLHLYFDSYEKILSSCK